MVGLCPYDGLSKTEGGKEATWKNWSSGRTRTSFLTVWSGRVKEEIKMNEIGMGEAWMTYPDTGITFLDGG